MKYQNTLLVVSDIKQSVQFYQDILDLQVILDFGANKTLTGGICLQTLDTWKCFIAMDEIIFGANNGELYFEEDNFDLFVEKLNNFPIEYVHRVKEHSWGQRVVRFYDPDKHIIEVGENMAAVCKRFLADGMTPEQVAIRMDVPLEWINDCL